jgi:hypothetical protein
MVEPVPTKNPGVYVAQVVSDVFIKAGNEFEKLSEAPRDNLSKDTGSVERKRVRINQGVPEDKWGSQGVPGKERGVWAVITPKSPGDREDSNCLHHAIV